MRSSDIGELFTEWLDENGQSIIEKHVDIEGNMEDAVEAAIGDLDVEVIASKEIRDAMENGDYDEQIINAVIKLVKTDTLTAYFREQDEKIADLEQSVSTMKYTIQILEQTVREMKSHVDKLSRPWYTRLFG